MKSFYDKEDYTFEDIQSLIDNQVEESIYLDFKEFGALQKSEGKKLDISKDVASFANSDGGIIVYGIKELEHKASELSYVDGNIFTKEWLEQIINSSIQRRIEGIMIYPIRYNNDVTKTVYVIKIPFSYDAPHLSKDNRYYKRFNFSSVPMEEYEIRQSYERKRRSKLEIEMLGWELQISTESVEITFIGTIYNSSNVVEPNYKVNVYFAPFNHMLNISYPQSSSSYMDYTNMGSQRMKVSSVARMPIFPNETLTGIRFSMNVQRENVVMAFEELDIEFRVMYPFGEDIYKVDNNRLISSIMNKIKEHDSFE